MDPENPIIKLCAAGMQAEFANNLDEARNLFEQAWQAHRDDFEACIAAHYLARHQDDPRLTLHWNALSLQYADALGDERVRGFYPSLYLNLGHSYEVLGDRAEAARYYDLASAHLNDLQDDAYGQVVREAVAAGQKRIAEEVDDG